MLFIAGYFSNDKVFPVTVTERSIQSVLEGHGTDGDIIGKAASNQPVKHSHRASHQGSPAPLTLGEYAITEVPLWCDLKAV